MIDEYREMTYNEDMRIKEMGEGMSLEDTAEEFHEHIMEDGTVVRHSHGTGAPQEHAHVHSHTQTKAVLNRLSRLIGHLESIRRMVEDGRDCSEVLIQLSAVDSALRGVGRVILKDHLEHCIVDAVRDGDRKAVEQLNQAIDQFMR